MRLILDPTITDLGQDVKRERAGGEQRKVLTGLHLLHLFSLGE